MHRSAGIILLTTHLAACARLARAAREDRLQAIGIPRETSLCMADELDRRLSDNDLQDLARYAFDVARQPSTLEAVRALLRFDNPRATAAIGKSAVECVTGFSL